MTPVKPKKDTGAVIGWTTVTYRSVLLGILAIVSMVSIVTYFIFPEQSKKVVDSTSTNVLAWLTKTGLIAPAKSDIPVGEQKAQFTMLDGTVKVRKHTSNTFVTAAYDLPLEKGDVVQTGPEGMAKIVFADMTNYTVRQDSLIVIEDNSTNIDKQTSVSVQVTTGTVDLTTGTYSQGSKSQVKVAGATASIAPESVAEVRNDAKTDSHEILVKKGGGEVERNGEVVSLSNYDKVTFTSDAKTLTKQKEVGPPILIDPGNMMPIFATGSTATIKFTWTPMENVKAYHVRIAKNAYFTQLAQEKRVTDAELLVPSLAEGAYYWSVQSVDDRGKESLESERNRFTIIPRSTGDEVKLELDPFIQHGRIIEVRGKTDPTARVMVNGGEVPIIGVDGAFRYLTPQLPNGESVITVTAQNAKGGVNTLTRRVVIQ